MKSSSAGLTLEGPEWRLSDHLGPDGRLVPVAEEVIATASTTGLPAQRCEGYPPAVNPTERMIPLLPCRSIDDQIGFYETLGFEVTYRQKAPNVYASVQRGGIELHFFVMKGYDPAGSYSTCYVMVADIDPLYADFRARLKEAMGRVPTRGMPRIGALKDMSYGVRQFLMTDPGGNIIRFGQPLEATEPQADRNAPASREGARCRQPADGFEGRSGDGRPRPGRRAGGDRRRSRRPPRPGSHPASGCRARRR